jgi:hypothetical protein
LKVAVVALVIVELALQYNFIGVAHHSGLIQEEEKEHARRSRGHKKQKELDEFFERLFSHLSVRERLRIVVILLLALLVFQIALFLGQNLLKDTLLP